MAATIKVDIVSAEQEIWSGAATMVAATGEAGELGILPRHTPLITRLVPGEVRVTLETGEEQLFYISGGILEVQPYVVTVLSDTAIRAADLDEAAAAEAQKHAEQALHNKTSAMDLAQAKAELAQAAAQLRTIQKLRSKR